MPEPMPHLPDASLADTGSAYRPQQAECSTPLSAQNSAALPALDAVSSALLLAGRDAVRIEHLGQCYVLRATRAGKLILTK